MSNKSNKMGAYNLGILLIGIILIIGFVALISALTTEEQVELDSLIAEINESGYGWLIDYSGDDLYPSVGVYEKIPAEILIKKMRIDEIKRGLNEYG
jgi:hypothetical protein